MLKVKRSKVVVSIIMFAVIAMIAAYFVETRQNYDGAAGNKTEITAPKDDQNQANEDRDQTKDSPNQSTATESGISKQETDALIDEMSGTLSDLEQTVNSLDDVSDSDLEIAE